MGYYNRKTQIKNVLNMFNENYSKYNIEVIIGDDKSVDNQQLDNILDKYLFKIKYIKIAQIKNWINPVIAYNICINNISHDTDIVIIQNPKILHFGDIIKYILEECDLVNI